MCPRADEGHSIPELARDESARLLAEGECWPEFLERAASRIAEEGLSDEPGRLFEAFRTTEDIGLTFATFAQLFRQATPSTDKHHGDAPWAGQGRFPYESMRLLLRGSRKASDLWKRLDERASRQEYAEAPCKGGPLEGRRVVVVGAGPCGLRAAVELRLLGARVTVVDRRTTFTRINQLHIWSWCAEDLKGLGARILEPPPMNFGVNPDLLTVCIADLQKLLLKVALLLGAEIFLGVDYAGTSWDVGSEGWRVQLGVPCGSAAEGRAGSAEIFSAERHDRLAGPTPAAPEFLENVAVVIGANGFGSTVGEAMGMQVQETQSLRPESAVGVICNFARQNGTAERELRSFSMAKQFFLGKFKTAYDECGADLENIVYTKSHLSHYFVMTPTHKSLVEAGVIIDRGYKPMLAGENIDVGKLDLFVRKVCSYPYRNGQPPVLLAAQQDAHSQEVGYADRGPRLFDFSRMRRQAEGVTFVPPPSLAGEESQYPDADHLLVGVVGDALMEPFWPEGLGIIRGFFSVLDCCSAIAEWAGGANPATVCARSESAFGQLKTVGAASRKQVLNDDETLYGLKPDSRYRHFASVGKALEIRGNCVKAVKETHAVKKWPKVTTAS